MSNRPTGGIPTKVRMPPCVFEIMVLAKFLKIAQLQEMTYREVALFGNVLGVIPSPVYSVDAIEDKTQISRQRFSGGQQALIFLYK